MPKVAVVGASGYAGGELLSLLLPHPECELVGVFGSGGGDAARPVGEVHPRLRGATRLAIEPASLEAILAPRPDAVLLATPHEASHELAPPLLDGGCVVLDLSAAFRLPDPAAYRRHYAFTHRRPDLLARAAYGLAELNAAAIAAADLIAVPGCYPTSVVLPLRPLVDAGVLDPAGTVVVDATSGVSGAGRAALARTSFCEVSLQAYGVMNHRHEPEIAAHGGVEVVFTPHLGPFPRGILSTIHLPLRRGVGDATLREILAGAYDGSPSVRLLPSGLWPSIAAVERTNFCDLGLAVHPERPHAVVSSAIDNLRKGAAGQAMQCLEIRFGLAASSDPETALPRRVALGSPR